MRVISGRAKGRKLRRVPGDATRPIMDRVKENLFNILGASVAGSYWLDLFAGTGQVGIEALSRGAEKVVFVDKHKPAIRTIRWNLEHTKLSEGAEVVHMDAFAYLKAYAGRPFDLVFIAPPQYRELWMDTLVQLDGRPSTYLAVDGLAVVQIDPKEYREIALSRLELCDQRRYGNTQLCFYRAD